MVPPEVLRPYHLFVATLAQPCARVAREGPPALVTGMTSKWSVYYFIQSCRASVQNCSTFEGGPHRWPGPECRLSAELQMVGFARQIYKPAIR